MVTSSLHEKTSQKSQFLWAISFEITKMADRLFYTAVIWMNKHTTSPTNDHLRKRSFSAMTGSGSVYTRATQSYMRRKILLCRFLLQWYEVRMKVDDRSNTFTIKLTILESTKNHKSLELEIVVKRVVLVFLVLLCCVVHSLINKGIV